MLLREVLYPFRVAEALGCLPSNGMPCSASDLAPASACAACSPEDDFESNGGVASDIGDKTLFSGLCVAERDAIAELRGLAVDGKCVSPMEFILGNFLSWVSSMVVETNARRFTSFARLLVFLILPWCCCGSLDGLPRVICPTDAR